MSTGSGPVTEVLCVMNIITEENFESEEDYENVLEEMHEECSRYGVVKSLEIPRPIPGVIVAGIGNVYVEFAEKADCQRAHADLTGRLFANRTTVASYFDIDKYKNRHF